MEAKQQLISSSFRLPSVNSTISAQSNSLVSFCFLACCLLTLLMKSLALGYTENQRRVQDHPSDPLASDSNLQSSKGNIYKQLKGKKSRKQGQHSQ